MKKHIIVLSAFLLYALFASAQYNNYRYGKAANQEKFNSIGIEYGFLSTANLTVYIGSSIVDYFIDEYGEEINHTGYSVTGPLGISYTRRIENFEIAGSFWFSRHSINFSGYPYGTPSIRTLGFLIDANYIYFNRNKINLYSGLSIGAGHIKLSNIVDDAIIRKLEKYTSTMYFASHFNLFGIRYGKDFGVSLETGFGHKGLIHFGVDYMF